MKSDVGRSFSTYISLLPISKKQNVDVVLVRVSPYHFRKEYKIKGFFQGFFVSALQSTFPKRKTIASIDLV
jgi:hypothetical protein